MCVCVWCVFRRLEQVEGAAEKKNPLFEWEVGEAWSYRRVAYSCMADILRTCRQPRLQCGTINPSFGVSIYIYLLPAGLNWAGFSMDFFSQNLLIYALNYVIMGGGYRTGTASLIFFWYWLTEFLAAISQNSERDAWGGVCGGASGDQTSAPGGDTADERCRQRGQRSFQVARAGGGGLLRVLLSRK